MRLHPLPRRNPGRLRHGGPGPAWIRCDVLSLDDTGFTVKRQSGLTCRSRASGHGFTLSRRRQRRF